MAVFLKKYSWLLLCCGSSLAGTLEYHAEVSPAALYALNAPALSVLEMVQVIPGQKVEKGEILFTLSSAELADKKALLQLELQKITAEYNQALNWKGSTSMQLATLRLEQSKLQVEEAQKRLSNTQRLLEAQAITPAEAAREQQQYQQATQQLKMSELEQIALQEQGGAARVSLLQAQCDYTASQLAAVQAQIEALTVKAPATGWVSYVPENKKNQGCFAWQLKSSCEGQQPFAVVVSNAPWIVEVVVDELDYFKIDLKTGVTIHPVTDIHRAYKATVAWKEPLPIKEKAELGHYKVRLVLEKSTPLWVGQSVIVKFMIDGA